MDRSQKITEKELIDKVIELHAAGKSGLVAFCRIWGTTRNEDDFWESHLSLLYFNEEDTVFLHESWGDRYCRFSNMKAWESFISEFIEDSNGTEHPVDTCGYTSEEYLAIVHSALLNHIAHEA